jgi:hypothetical protein
MFWALRCNVVCLFGDFGVPPLYRSVANDNSSSRVVDRWPRYVRYVRYVRCLRGSFYKGPKMKAQRMEAQRMEAQKWKMSLSPHLSFVHILPTVPTFRLHKSNLCFASISKRGTIYFYSKSFTCTGTICNALITFEPCSYSTTFCRIL